MESSTPAQIRAFAYVSKSAAFYSLQPVSVSVPHPWKFQLCLLHCICLGWHSGLNHISVLTLQVGCVSPPSLLTVQLWGGETGWCCNSRHCGLEAGTLLPIRIKWRTLALHFQHSVCLGRWSWAQCTVIIERVIQHFHSLFVSSLGLPWMLSQRHILLWHVYLQLYMRASYSAFSETHH